MNKDSKTGFIFFGFSLLLILYLVSPIFFSSKPFLEGQFIKVPWFPVILIVGCMTLGVLMIWTGYREKWLRKNGINIEGKITSFKTVSTPSSAGEFIDVKHLVVEMVVDGKKVSFLSRGLYPEKEYRIPNLGENIDIYYKKGNPTVYFVDVSRLKNTP